MSSPHDNPLLDAFRGMIGSSFDPGTPSLTSWLNGTLLEIDDGKVAASYVVRPEMTNPSGAFHGGIAAAIMDELAGMMVLISHGGRYFATVNLSIDYLASARAGESVIGRARIVRRGRRMVNVECSVENAHGEIVARATTNLLAIGEK